MSSQQTTGWQSEPDRRGTWGILISCLATLFLCVHTALHLNVPPKWAGKRWIFMHKLTWVLMGMFAPELVVFTAWSQWMSAKRLTEKVNQSMQKQDCAKKLEWTMTHSHYAQMGGFAVDTDDPGEDQYIPGSPRLFLTANGAATLAEMGHLPVISEESILDKSKTNSLGKSIVIVQATWLILQCLGRVIVHLPLAPLELNTLAHAACALVMYFLWWDKPVNIRVPTVLSGSWCRPVVAAMWMFSHVSTVKDHNSRNSSTLPPEIESLVHIEREENDERKGEVLGQTIMANDAVIEMESRSRSGSDVYDRPSSPSKAEMEYDEFSGRLLKININGMFNDQSSTPHPKMKIELSEGDFLLPFGFGPKAPSKRFQTRNVSRSKMPRYFTPRVATTVDNITLNRWRLAQQCIREHPEIWERYRREVRFFILKGEQWVLSEYPAKLCRDTFVDPEISNWPGPCLIREKKSYPPILFFSICVMLYGGLHAAAWNGFFPTTDERTLWRLSSVYIACSGLLYAYTEALNPISERIKVIIGYADSEQGFVGRWFGYLLYLLATILMLLIWTAFCGAVCFYILARGFIILEIFISLRNLPIDVYNTPRWTQYLSHL